MATSTAKLECEPWPCRGQTAFDDLDYSDQRRQPRLGSFRRTHHLRHIISWGFRKESRVAIFTAIRKPARTHNSFSIQPRLLRSAHGVAHARRTGANGGQGYPLCEGQWREILPKSFVKQLGFPLFPAVFWYLQYFPNEGILQSYRIYMPQSLAFAPDFAYAASCISFKIDEVCDFRAVWRSTCVFWILGPIKT